MKREKVNVIRNVFVTKYKISNLFDIIIKSKSVKQKLRNALLYIVKKNYTKDKQGKVFGQYQKI